MPNSFRIGLTFPALLLVLVIPKPAVAQSVTWEEISPIFQQRCIMCHSGQFAPQGLRLDSRDGLLEGSENGPVAIPGKPAESELIRRVRGESQPRMPLTGPPWLTDAEIGLLEKWIAGLPKKPSRGAVPQPEPGPPAERQAASEPFPQTAALKRDGPPTWVDVAPTFLSRCAKCHSESGIMGPAPEGFLATGYREILAASERARIIPGAPGASEVVRRVRGLSLPRMPFDGPPWLEDEQVALIEDWIAAGARDERGNPAPVPVGARVRLEGTLTGLWQVDGQPLVVDGRTGLKKGPGIGSRVEVRGVVQPDGSIRATRIRPR